VVVLFITAMLVDIVDMVVDVVVLGKAGRPAVVPAGLKERKRKKHMALNHHFLKQGKKEIIVSPLSKSSALQQTLKTTFMLWDEHRPPMRRCKSSLDDVAIEKKEKVI
jgi:hypothetical protein